MINVNLRKNLLHTLPYLLIDMAVEETRKARGTGTMTATFWTRLWHAVNRGIPFNIWSFEVVATICAFESDCSSYHNIIGI